MFGNTVDLNLCIGSELAMEKLENKIFPVVIKGNLTYEFLKEHGNFYVQLNNQDFDESIFILEPNENLNVGQLILEDDPDFRLLVASEEYYPNDAKYVGNNGEGYRVSEYANKIIEDIELNMEQGRAR